MPGNQHLNGAAFSRNEIRRGRFGAFQSRMQFGDDSLSELLGFAGPDPGSGRTPDWIGIIFVNSSASHSKPAERIAAWAKPIRVEPVVALSALVLKRMSIVACFPNSTSSPRAMTFE